MLIKSPKKILGVPIDGGATSYHRIVQPLYELSKNPSWTQKIQFLGSKEEQLGQYAWADIVLIQALYAPDAYRFYVEQKKQGKFIVLDFDDDYINIPSDSPEQTEIIDKETGEVHRFGPEFRGLFIQMFIQLADIVTVTNAQLRQVYSAWNKNIKIIPNCVSKDMYRDIPKEPSDKVRILWSGSRSHLPDLELLKEPLQKIHQKYGDKIELHFQGGLDFNQVFPNLPIICHPAVDFPEYLNAVQAINADIAIAPLRNHIFNDSKSNLKYCQMTLMDAAFVASNYGPYKHIDDEYDGMLAKNDGEWVEALSKCIESPQLRQKLITNAKKYVESNHMIEKQIYTWEDIFSR